MEAKLQPTLELFSFSERESCIIVAKDIQFGPAEQDPAVEVLTGQQGTKKLPYLPNRIIGPSLVIHKGTILLCGGRFTCFALDEDCTWKEHSKLNLERYGNSLATTT